MAKGIYKIENIWDGKVYIGESNNIEERWIKHKEDLNNNKHHSKKLQEAWNKDGENSFIFEVIEEIDVNLKTVIQQGLLFIYEDKYIKQYNSINNGYNIQNTLELILKGNKTIFAKHKMTNKSLAIFKNLIKNIKKNNGIYIPSENAIKLESDSKPIKEKKPIKNKVEENKSIPIPKSESEYKIKKRLNINLEESQLTKKDIEYIINKCLNYNFKQEYEQMNIVLKENGFNVAKTYQLLRDINILNLDNNLCLINDDSMFNTELRFLKDEETKNITKEYYVTYINNKGFKYLLHRILTECKNNNINVFTLSFIIEVKNNTNINNNSNIIA